MSEDRFYQVEKVVGYKLVRGVPHYKVHWLGYGSSHDSWEPAANLETCQSLIEQFHLGREVPSAAHMKRSSTRRSLAVVGRSLEISSDEEAIPQPLRRSQRSHTPMCLFGTEESSTSATISTTRRQKTTKPTTKQKRKVPEKRDEKEKEEEEEDSEEDEEFDVHRSEYELRSQAALRRSPRRLDSVHYYNSELPQPRKPHSGSELSKTVLSSDEEGGGGDPVAVSSVTPQISVYESQVRKRLSNLSSLTRQKLTDALTSITGENSNDADSTQNKPTVPPSPISQPTHATSTLTSASRVYETRSHATDPPPQATTRTALRSRAPPPPPPPPPAKTTPAHDSPDSPVQVQSEPLPGLSDTESTASFTTPHEEEVHPKWMELGWEEAIFAVILTGLLLFAYYCFNSEDC